MGTPIPPSGPVLGIAERRMWRIHRLDPDSVSHNITLLLDTDGASTGHLVAGIECVLTRAGVLGSVITVDDEGTPYREPRAQSGRWIEECARWALGAGPVDGDVEQLADALARLPFDLTTHTPVRARVVGSTVVLSFHHLAVDDTSWPLLLGSILAGRWIGAAHSEAPTGEPLTPIDAVENVDPARVGLAVEHARATWAAPGIAFPLSGELPAATPEQSWLAPLDEAPGRQLRQHLDAADLAAFTAFAPTVGATGSAALVALTALTVTAVTGAHDHVLLVPADNRGPGHTPDRVGYCGNIIPIRFTFDLEGSVGEALRAGVAAIYAAMTYADVDFGSVLTALRHSGGRFPVVEILASVRTAPMCGVQVPAGMSVDYRSISTGLAPYPLSLAVELADDGRAHLEVDFQLGTGEVVAEHAAAVVVSLLHRLPSAVDEPLAALLGATPTQQSRKRGSA